MTRSSVPRSRRRGRQAASSAKPAAEGKRARRWFARRGVQATLIFALLLAVYLANGDILPGQDPTANVRLAGKLVSRGSLVFTPEEEPFMFEWSLQTAQGEQTATFRAWQSRLDGEPVRRSFERGRLGKPKPYYYLLPTRYPGVFANVYGIGAGLFAVPFVAAVYPFAPDLYRRPSALLLWHAAKVAAACAVAGSAVFLFLAALAFVRPGTAAGLALAYGLGTCVWSTSSQALWQHGPTEFFLALGTFCLLRRERPGSAYCVGLAYALAFACRPTSGLALAAAGGYYLLRDRRSLVRLVAGGLPIALGLAAYNLHYFGRLFVFGQLATGPHAKALPSSAVAALGGRAFSAPFWEGIAGILVSPSRGLLVFSPILAFAFWGAFRAWRDPRFAPLRPVSIAALAMCLLVARWHGWWGGWCYGYRLLVDAVTLLAFLAIPVAEHIRSRRPLAAGFAVCLFWAVGVQVVGAYAYDVVSWNDRPFLSVKLPDSEEPLLFLDEDEARRQARARGGVLGETRVNVNYPRGRSRRWSLRDSEILYYLQYFGEARRTKKAAIEQFARTQG
ncbi:MAG: hypothetical protein JXP73_11480 [Deltaproteobacteria bacterium]|nr:hypothetical protein [Deltaproteobacteria bacterium]